MSEMKPPEGRLEQWIRQLQHPDSRYALDDLAALCVRLEAAEQYCDGQHFRSDYRTAGEMRVALTQAQDRVATLEGMLSNNGIPEIP